ncbi:phage terminase large subunit [Fusobacterium vincentii]
MMTGSYNETLSSTFAKQVRDMIATEQTRGVTVYRDIFPDTKIKYGEASMNKWALEGSQVANYLATSPTGTATGFGADLIVIDDLIKNSEEAYNSNVLEKHIDWFTNTMLSRTEKGFKLIIIMTRWASNDLAGFILSNYDDVVHINYKAINDDGTPLDEETLSLEDFEFKTKNMAKEIVYANYQQEPIDIKGRLYSEFKTYVDLPKEKIVKIASYCDTADTGDDFLCNIIYADCKDSAYILDVIYTKEAMEITEPLVAEAYKKFNVNVADIESNNGGRAFARNIERITRDRGNYKTVVKWFHQSGNKIARILSNSAWVNNNIYMHVDWKNKWSEFAKDIISYQKEGKNKHDDGPDALTGVAEKVINRNEVRTIDRNVLGIR